MQKIKKPAILLNVRTKEEKLIETFENIAGYKNEKKEALDLCMVLENFEEYKKFGINLPRGLLLYGEPGVGKTLFAKAIATKTGRKFVEADLTSGVTVDIPLLIKKKYEEAVKNSPSILFIDEIDKVVPVNGELFRFVSDNSRQNLSLLLSLLDGYQEKDEVLLITTSNDLKSLPEPLVRAGRIDKHIGLKIPDDESREEIIKYYMDKISLEKEYNLKELILITDGMTGADIKTLINEAAIDAVNNKNNVITTKKLLEFAARISDKELIKFNHNNLSKDESSIVAYHELGHFVAANSLNKIIKEVSIVNNETSLGRVSIKFKSKTITNKEIFIQAVIALAGKAAEEIFLKENYTGSANDSEKAYLIIEYLLTSGGMGLKYLYPTYAVTGTSKKRESINVKTKKLMKKAYRKAYKIVKENKNLIEKIHPILLEEKVLTGIRLQEFAEGTITKEDVLIIEDRESRYY